MRARGSGCYGCTGEHVLVSRIVNECVICIAVAVAVTVAVSEMADGVRVEAKEHIAGLRHASKSRHMFWPSELELRTWLVRN